MRKSIRKILESQVISATDTHDQNIRHKIKNGTVEAVKVGKAWILDKEDIKGSQ